MVDAVQVQRAFTLLRSRGFAPNGQSIKWDVIDPLTGERFPPKAVLRVAKELAGDKSSSLGGGWPTNDPLNKLGFEIVLKGEERTSLEGDLNDIMTEEVDETVKARLVNARLGQGSFREALLEIWGGKCALTCCDFAPLLRASHIKPWRDASNRERLDPNNGLLLVSHIDALFDRCLLTFADDGTVLVSSSVPPGLLPSLGVSPDAKVSLSDSNRRFLAGHRSEFRKR